MRAYIRTYSYYSTHRLTRPACADRDAAAARWRMRCCRATGIRTRAPALAPPSLLSHHPGPPRSRGRTRRPEPEAPPRACPGHTAAGRAGPVAAGCTALPPPGRNATDAHRPPGHRRGRGRTYAAADGAGGGVYGSAAGTAGQATSWSHRRVRACRAAVRAGGGGERASEVRWALWPPRPPHCARRSGTGPGDRTLASALAAGSSQPSVPDGSMECDCARARRPVRSPDGNQHGAPAARPGVRYGHGTHP